MWMRLRVWLQGERRWFADRCRHRLTQPGQRDKAIALWRRCAAIWCASRFGAVEGWKPAQPALPRVVGPVRRMNGRRVICG